MPNFTDVAALIPSLSTHLVEGSDAELAQAVMMLMSDAEIVSVLAETATLTKQVEEIQVLAAGVVAVRSRRERGHLGLSQSRGHRSAASFVQNATGSSKAEANRKVRVGEALLDDEPASTGERSQPEDGQTRDERPVSAPWYQPLRDALRDGRLTSSQFDAIQRGLGDPPEIDSEGQVDADARAAAQKEAREAWARASEHLVSEAPERTVEELWQQARSIRDLLDPDGAEERFLARFEQRSFRIFRGQDGQKRANMVLDDEGDLFLETLLAAGLRPRRGGPRFVDADEKDQAASLADDPRTNDQLAYDLMMDVLRAGSLADAESVFGTRQAGVRLVQTVRADGNAAPIAHAEDHLVSVPGAVAEQRICESGVVPITVDSCGNPLNMGREQRLFTSQQRIALAVRDGGCRWRGCDRPASYCEAHHIDPYSEGGRTDVDRGILLCRYHHMTLHHGRWKVTRSGIGDFILHHPAGETFAMRPRAALNYAWGGIGPPPKRFRPVA